jgi:2-polyprenyl-3-methyl-5-hydroxy-6-metoxy-1,4-benzoquinol methylase
MSACRLCNSPLSEVLMQLEGMPASAQNLPTQQQLAFDNAEDLAVRQCEGCGLVQVDCEPVDYYREVVRAIAFSEEMAQFRRSQLSQFAQRYGLIGKSVLEVGCGKGEYLGLLAETGMVPFGTEYGTASATVAKSQGHSVQQVFPDSVNIRLEGAPYEAFFSFNFMEHWPDPRTVLRTVSTNLTSSAVGLIEVPNFDMLLEKQMATEFVSDHLSYFTTATFRTALELSGFEVLDVQEVWYRYILSAEVRKRPRLAAEPFQTALLAQKNRALEFINKAGPEGIAVWGAGHQALATIALLGLKHSIRYIVDSAPFKQGKYTPATHIPIYAPDQLDSQPVDSILIMAAGFSDEVARIIRSRWGEKFRIAILREDVLEEL